MVVQRATFCNTWRDIFHSNRQRKVLSLYYIAVVVVSFFLVKLQHFVSFLSVFMTHAPRRQNPLGSDRNTSLSTEKVNESESRLFSNRGGGELKRTR